MRAEPVDAWLQNGRLHIGADAYAQRFPDCVAVALMADGKDWLLFPLRSGAGGLQVKIRNAKGDRVIESQEFFRAQGLEDSPQARRLILHDELQHAALRIELMPG